VNARDQILDRVRAAIAPALETPSLEIPRGYRTELEGGVERFIARLAHYDAKARQVAEAELDDAVRAVLEERGARRVVAPAGLPDAWLAGVEPVRDSPSLQPHTLDRCDGFLSTCAVAIAETGTIVLDGGPGMGRRALSLVPDYHLCVVRHEQIVGSVPEALARLDATRPLTFISGPSATVDIELVRVAGVHGPRTLEVIVSEGAGVHRG
jgi:L-lactate dehydrogenase complex protein LldG